jgi:large subunit ribosomal protein L14e
VIPKVPFGIGHTGLKKLWDADKAEEKFYESSYAKGKAKLARRKQLSDFERFKVMALRKQARFEVRKQLASSKGKA